MKVERLEQTIGKKVLCTDGAMRSGLVFDGEKYAWEKQIALDYFADCLPEPKWVAENLFIGGTIEEMSTLPPAKSGHQS